MRANASRRLRDFGFSMLPSLDNAGKVFSAWILDPADPDGNLTLDGSNVTGWAAAYGTQKVDLVELTDPPAWDASLFGNRGGVVFDGIVQRLEAVDGNIANWPGPSVGCYLIAAVRQDAIVDGVDRFAFAYGGGTFGVPKRAIGIISDVVGMKLNGTSILSGSGFVGSHVIGARVGVGGNVSLYLDGALVGTTATPSHTFSLSNASIGAPFGSGFRWTGAIAAVAILNISTTEAEFLNLMGEFGTRV